MDKSLWQTISKIDFFHSSHKWIQTLLWCRKHCTTMQLRIVSGLWLCRRFRRLKIDFRETDVHIWKSYICSNKLDVQDTNFSFTQFNRIRHHLFSVSHNIVMWETRLSIVDLVYSKTQILLGTLGMQNQPRDESYVFLEVEHLFPQVGCARNKLQYPFALLNQKSFSWMLDCEWMDYLL